jgi:hypothetical protein
MPTGYTTSPAKLVRTTSPAKLVAIEGSFDFQIVSIHFLHQRDHENHHQ